MDYKTEMRKLIDIVKQQSFDAPLESTLEDLTTLSTAVKDLSDRINTRTKKSLNPNDKVKAKKKSKEIGRAHVRTPVTEKSRMPSSA